MHTVSVKLTPKEAVELEEKILTIANELGRALSFSILKNDRGTSLQGFFKSRTASLKELKLVGLESRAHHGYLHDHHWQDSMKRHFKPFYYRNVAWVPAWIKSPKSKILRSASKPPAAEQCVLRFGPGMAFGSGNHPTTRMFLRRLVELVEEYKGQKTHAKGAYRGPSAPVLIPSPREGLGVGECPHSPIILDIGCGSGILAITADKLGAHAYGIDLDQQAVDISKKNAKLNRSKATFKQGNVYKAKLPKADIVMANLLANLIKDNANKLWECVRPGGTIVLSGLLKEELKKVAEYFPGDARLYRLGSWGAVVVRKR